MPSHAYPAPSPEKSDAHMHFLICASCTGLILAALAGLWKLKTDEGKMLAGSGRVIEIEELAMRPAGDFKIRAHRTMREEEVPMSPRDRAILGADAAQAFEAQSESAMVAIVSLKLPGQVALEGKQLDAVLRQMSIEIIKEIGHPLNFSSEGDLELVGETFHRYKSLLQSAAGKKAVVDVVSGIRKQKLVILVVGTKHIHEGVNGKEFRDKVIKSLAIHEKKDENKGIWAKVKSYF